jgi:type IV pilus assembly protein PilC
LESAGIFSGIYSKMVSVGFKTGSADTVMKKLADRYEEEIDARVGNLIALLEPSLVAVLSVIVGMILLSVMLPLMGIMSSIG